MLSIYDYIVVSYLVKNTCRFGNKNIHFIFVGVIYSITISVGIFNTNSIWYSTQIYDTNNGPLWYIVASIVSVIFSSFWILMQDIILNNIEGSYYGLCLIRSFFEFIAFNGICINTYYMWNFLVSLNIPNFLFLSSLLGFIGHFICSLVVVSLEHVRNISGSLSILYGFMYYLSWSFVVISTNGLLGFTSPHLYGFTIQLVLTFITFIIIIVTAPNFYRSAGINLTFLILLVHVLKNFVLIDSYVIHNYLLYQPFIPI